MIMDMLPGAAVHVLSLKSVRMLASAKTNGSEKSKAHNQRTNVGSGRACSAVEEREAVGFCEAWLLRIDKAPPNQGTKCWERPCMFCRSIAAQFSCPNILLSPFY